MSSRRTSGAARPHTSRAQARHGQSAQRESPVPDPLSKRKEQLAAYQDRVTALEGALSSVRAQAENLAVKLGESRQDQARTEELFQNTPVPYIVHDTTGHLIAMNASAASLLGVNPRSSAKAGLARYFSQDNLLRWFKHMQACISSKKLTVSQLEIRSHENGALKVEFHTVSGAKNTAARPERFHTLIVDITRRRALEAALAQKQQYYHQLVDMIEGIVWEADPQDLTITFVNGYAERLLGFPLEGWSHPGFWQNRIFVQDRERVLDALNRASADRKELRIDYRVMRADRNLIWLHDCIRFIDQDGRSKLLGVAVDITERRIAEEQLRQAHSSLEQSVAERTTELRHTVADLEGFSYSLSHDLRAPIRAMQGYAALVRDMVGDKLGPKPTEYLQRIMQSAERLDLLVQDVLQYSKTARTPLELRPVPLQPLLEGILHEHPALDTDRARIRLERPMPSVLAHEAFVGQALSNLLTNAVKFVPKGRTPRVRVWTEPVRLPSGGGDQWVRIWVEDNGLGIALEDQARIFRFFERVYPNEQYEGTGMGLAIVQKAIERLGGRLGVESALGQGSRFWIELRQAFCS